MLLRDNFRGRLHARFGPTVGTKLKVFISYSRCDLDFADQLVSVLELQGFLPIIDRKGIHGAERYQHTDRPYWGSAV